MPILCLLDLTVSDEGMNSSASLHRSVSFCLTCLDTVVRRTHTIIYFFLEHRSLSLCGALFIPDDSPLKSLLPGIEMASPASF